jgi:hypothetical protein
MGGLALKHLGVQRIPAQQYVDLAARVQQRFTTLFGQRPDIVPSYKQKADFGDCGMLVTSAELPGLWREGLAAASSSRGWLRNGDVTSMEIENVQFDFINVPRHARNLAYVYFAYNDLGNLMGRVAHKMGFKYGHNGLVYVVRDRDHVLAELAISASLPEVFDFLGYDYTRWTQGFDDLEDIFKFAASSRFFHKDIYLLHNRNAVSRIRDAKRPTYTKFLLWCETSEHLPEYLWQTDEDYKRIQRKLQLHRATDTWPELGQQIAQVQVESLAHKKWKLLFNGELVRAWTGLGGKCLGVFMRDCEVDWLERPETRPDTVETVRNYVLAKVNKNA